MTSRLALHPDLNDAVLEDRTLMAYSPFVPQFILTTSGYTGLAAPPGMSANLGTLGGGGIGGGGGNMGTGFYVTGFGTSTLAIGNTTGFAGVGVATGGSTSGTGLPGIQVGSGANAGGGGGGSTIVTRNTVAQGGTTAAELDTLYIGRTTGTGSPAGGYAGAGAAQPAPVQGQPPVPAAPPP